MRDINKEIAIDMLNQMPESKVEQLKKALNRNCFLTSTYILENGTMHIYKEGFYLELFGTRCKFTVWAKDNDGEFVFGRKPIEEKLHKIYDDFLKFDIDDFNSFR